MKVLLYRLAATPGPERPVEDVVDYLSQFAGELPVERPDLIPSGVGGTA
jgi:hypothetical protein